MNNVLKSFLIAFAIAVGLPSALMFLGYLADTYSWAGPMIIIGSVFAVIWWIIYLNINIWD